MALTAEQEARAHAWAQVFQDGMATNVVLDDMQQYARQFPDALERAGATGMILYILLQRSRLRREKRKEPKRA